jgi:ubiquinone/menaquinone biosynthesis C-methylase UbiE
MTNLPENVFVGDAYLKKVPGWHADDSPWKARHILEMLERNHLSPRTIGEVGCGTGEVLRQLQLQMSSECRFLGYDIAPRAIALSQSRQNERLHCKLGSVLDDQAAQFDLLLLLDVMEHQENYFEFLRAMKPLAPYKVVHTVLDLSMHALVRADGLTKPRSEFDDLHFFTKETVLQALQGEGYEIVAYSYIPRAVHRSKDKSLATKLEQLPRVLGFLLDRDLAARVLGGYSLLVLAK